VRNRIVFLVIVFVMTSHSYSQDLHQKRLSVEITLHPGQTVTSLQDLLPDVKVVRVEDGSCSVELDAKDVHLLRRAGFDFKFSEMPASLMFERGLVKTSSGGNPLIQEMVDAVSKDTMFTVIRGLQAFKTRYEFTPQQDTAADYILGKLQGWGLQAESDWYSFGLVSLYDISMINPDTGWIVGGGSSIVATTNGGQTWIANTSPVVSTFYGVDFVNGGVGWAVGSGGTIVGTTDGGANWVSQSSGSTVDLMDVRFINQNLGIAVGFSGKILRTTNGGTSWSPIGSPTANVLREIEFLDLLNVWVAGYNGTIIHSTDGGLNWSAQRSGVDDYLFGVDFVDPNQGWIVGYGGRILKTTNGGSEWQLINVSAAAGTNLRGVCFVDASRGWAVDYSGILLNTSDGGQNWKKKPLVLSSAWGPFLFQMKATGDKRLTVCGSRATLLCSTDKGATWSNQTSGLPSSLQHTTRNIVATVPGTTTPDKECIIVAHYDSYSNDLYNNAPGANDNGSGTSAVMEAARICKDYQFESTIRFLAVSAEELGMYGSEHYAYSARNQQRNIICAVNGDMIGYPTTSDTARLVVVSYLTRNWLVDSAMAYNQRYGIGLTLVGLVDNTGASDYAPFAMAGYDALDVAEGTAEEIWGGADPYYHKTSDTVDKLKPSMVRRAAQLMLATVAEVARPIRKSTPVVRAEIPARFELEQNYPNPFNPTTTFTFAVPVRSHVTLRVFNVLGSEVSTVVTGEIEAGTHSVRWNAEGLPSGVYFSRLRSGAFSETKRLVLVR
jgi:photosystem II stability/assembly factor-like uncharacterized protein